MEVLVAANFTCEWCGTWFVDTSDLVGDHKVPHKGDPDLFWDRDNVQCLCKPCHDRHKQAQEARSAWG